MKAANKARSNNGRAGNGIDLLQPGATLDLPMIGDLAATLHFAPEQGHIWLAGRRMVLVHAHTIGIMRREVIKAMGYERARALFTRQGYEAGAMDADVAARVRGGGSAFDAFSVGPQLHALGGAVLVEPVAFELDIAGGKFYAEYRWRHSTECSEHIAALGMGEAPAGWGQIGYASGYASVYLGRPIVYREVECIAMGCPHCLIVGKPAEEWDDAEYDLSTMRAAPAHAHVHAEVRLPFGQAAGAGGEEDQWRLVGNSAGMTVAVDLLRSVADIDAPVLMHGEGGVGKEMFARALHAMSRRANKPFVVLNCQAMGEAAIEAELFARFARADGGTVFLDEIAALSLPAQAALMRVMEDREIERGGAGRAQALDVRLVAATTADLRAALAGGTIRADLFYRMMVFMVRIPPLRDRREDIPLLMDHFLDRYRVKYRREVAGFDEQAMSAMLSYDWPGNVRELEAAVERGVILGRPGEMLRLHHLFTGGERVGEQRFELGSDGRIHPSGGTEQGGEGRASAVETLVELGGGLAGVEQAMLRQALGRCGGNRSAAARLLGLSRSQFNYRLNT